MSKSKQKPARKSTKAKTPSKRSAIKEPPSIAKARAAAFTDEHPEKAFRHFKPLAEKVPLAGLPIFTGQPLLMRANVLHALEVVTPHLPMAVAKLRSAPLREIFELPSLTLALDFAVTRVPVAKLSPGEIDAKLNEGGPWRELMLSYLEVVSHPFIGLLPRERVQAVRAGSGKLDKARDFVALAGLFHEFSDALCDKHPFPSDKLELLGTLGATLLQQVRPGRAASEAPKRAAEALLRDRFAALVEERYDALQVLAAVALGRRRADTLLPALRSGSAIGGAVREELPEEPTPAVTEPTIVTSPAPVLPIGDAPN
jgi:hypothetical protein